jgi:hypothetical protein
MKKTALILVFLACYINYQGFAGGGKDQGQKAATEDIKKIDERINEISKEVTMIKEEIKILREDKRVPTSEDPPTETAAGEKIPVTPKTDSSETDKLTVTDRNNQTSETEASYAGPLNDDQHPPRPAQTQNENANNPEDQSKQAKPSRNIMGGGSIKPQAVIAYVYAKEKNPPLDRGAIEKLINTYIKEAADEGVNADIGIAQMLHWTSNLKNSERVASCNYGGLSAIDDWNGRFPYRLRDGMTEGVRAHIQHLKAYAKEPLRLSKVDPRYDIVFERDITGITFEQVYKYWSDNPRYGKSIDDILIALYSIQSLM